ncbi:MAG: PEP-CTERM sorting domain-containing protein [Cyanobacteria bacterium SBLK]|nr:PEP-CTERM sorting domain-containing protein [Cyanobacteria bacterium SBLK]
MAYSVQFDAQELVYFNKEIDISDVFVDFIDPPAHNPGFLHTHVFGFVEPNRTIPLDIITFQVLDGLSNSGNPDFSLSVTTAIGVNGTDLTSLFASNQIVEVQPKPTPEPTSIFSILVLSTLGVATFRRKSS